MSKRIQYVSSLYVNTFAKLHVADLIRPIAPILVLSGNIGLPRAKQTSDFLRFCSANWNSVVYVPGPLELSEGLPNFMRLKKNNFDNLELLCKKSVKIDGIVYVGCPYLSIEDDKWLVTEILKYKYIEPHIVCVTFGIPHLNMTLSMDMTDHRKFYAPAHLNPKVSAWISGYVRGAKTCVFDNGVLAVYNARGNQDGANDMDGSKGWIRDAFLALPSADPCVKT